VHGSKQSRDEPLPGATVPHLVQPLRVAVPTRDSMRDVDAFEVQP
jgi:hypothetical protein